MTGRRATLLVLLLTGCVLPDRDIVIVDEDVQNKHPVRFVEPTPVTNEASNECFALLDKQFDDSNHVCQPIDPEFVLPAFLDPDYSEEGDAGQAVYPYRFCSCDQDKEDLVKLPEATLYVEDRANVVKDGLDNVYAALQLDLLPSETRPQKKVEYTQFVDPRLPLQPPANELFYEPPKRPPSAAGRDLVVVNLGFSGRGIDLCNDLGQPLTRGYHTLRVIVTDAPWYLPKDEDGKDLDEFQRQIGVPDLGNGATYDTLTYTFFCGVFKAAVDDAPAVDAHCENQCGPPMEYE